ncbi:membrane protein, partial [Chromobacterium piscinae]
LALPDSAAVGVAFALGALPIDSIIKLLRRLVNSKLSTNEADQPDPLLSLDGVTPAIASQLEAEGVSSIDQLLDMDPVLLAIHTGLPFRFILRLMSQAIVRRHLGDAAFAL